MSLTVHIYCNSIEQGTVEVAHNETNDSLKNKILAQTNIEHFIFEEGFDVSTLCQDDNICIYYDSVTSAASAVNKYLDEGEFKDHIGNKRFISVLIDAKMVNSLIDNTNGRTALHLASYKGCKGYNSIVKMLLEGGADIDAVDNNGDTALHIALGTSNNFSLYNKEDITAKTLIDAGADINARNDDGQTTLHIAVMYCRTEMVKNLIEFGADIIAKNNEGNTMLHEAAGYNNSIEMVAIFLNTDQRINGYKNNTSSLIDINCQNVYGLTALHYASGVGCIYVVQMLINSGARIDIKNNEGETALFYAVSSYVENNIGIVRMLIKAGADVNVENNDGYTVIDRASGQLKYDILDVLTEAAQ